MWYWYDILETRDGCLHGICNKYYCIMRAVCCAPLLLLLLLHHSTDQHCRTMANNIQNMKWTIAISVHYFTINSGEFFFMSEKKSPTKVPMKRKKISRIGNERNEQQKNGCPQNGFHIEKIDVRIHSCVFSIVNRLVLNGAVIERILAAFLCSQ